MEGLMQKFAHRAGVKALDDFASGLPEPKGVTARVLFRPRKGDFFVVRTVIEAQPVNMLELKRKFEENLSTKGFLLQILRALEKTDVPDEEKRRLSTRVANLALAFSNYCSLGLLKAELGQHLHSATILDAVPESYFEKKDFGQLVRPSSSGFREPDPLPLSLEHEREGLYSVVFRGYPVKNPSSSEDLLVARLRESLAQEQSSHIAQTVDPLASKISDLLSRKGVFVVTNQSGL